MKYELLDKYIIKRITHCIRNMIIDGKEYLNMETSNPTDDILDELNIGMYLDETAIIPEYDSSIQYLKINYIIVDNKIVKGYEICDIIPSEIDVLKNQINRVDSAFDEFMTIVLPEVLI